MKDVHYLSEINAVKPLIYADNAATTQLDKSAFEEMLPWLQAEYGNASQPYSFARKPKAALADARAIIAACINAKPEEIFFTSGGTESDNWAIKGSAFSIIEKKQTITSSIEHHAVLNACKSIARLGYPVTFLKPNKHGIITTEELAKQLGNQTHLVSIMFSNNEIGTIEPIQELAEIAHSFGAVFHTDAVQAIGHVPIDVKQLGIDLLSASAHKFNGPKGVGFLYVRQGTRIFPFNDGGSQERGLRAGTENIAGIVGMASALKTNCDSMENNQKHLKELEEVLLSTISQLDYLRNGDNLHIPGNISLSFRDSDGEMILHRMDLRGIQISTGSACDSINTAVSHVIKAIQVPDEYANGTIRISFGKNNTKEEARIIGEALIQILKS